MKNEQLDNLMLRLERLTRDVKTLIADRVTIEPPKRSAYLLDLLADGETSLREAIYEVLSDIRAGKE